MFLSIVVKMEFNDIIGDAEERLRQWRPRAVLRRTNWLYRIDALRPRDLRDMEVLRDLVELYQSYAEQFVIWSRTLQIFRTRLTDQHQLLRLGKIIKTIDIMSKNMLDEGYCYYLEYLSVAYYPTSNRITRSNEGDRFPPFQNTSIDSLGENQCRQMTGLSVAQLLLLHKHLRIPLQIRDDVSRRSYSGEEAFLHYVTYNRLGITKLQLSLYHFGGDPRRFTNTIRAITNYIYVTFYHKISGDSMTQWLSSIDTFREAIWRKIVTGGTIESSTNNSGDTDTLIHIDIPFNTFRIFGMVDDTGFRTSAPGIEARRVMGFNDDVQRSFYSGYFAGHGIKIQAVSLPNGMIGSIFVGSWRVSDSGLLNLSGLDTYLSSIFHENGIIINGTELSYPVLYGDGVFPNLPTILPRYNNPSLNERRINTRLANVRQNIEHIFGLHRNVFALFKRPERFQLLHQGKEAVRLIFNSFLLLNCYTCFNESTCPFLLRPPQIHEYLPLEEPLAEAPNVEDSDLGEVYTYSRR